ncbi:MAG: hypothetical protein ACOX7G_11670 [Candidatus Scatomorpha sp.]|jgi:hypothetical protein
MFERYFNSFNTRFDDRGSRTAANESACAFSAANSDSRRENSIILLSLDTVLAVSIFAALRLIAIRLISLVSVIVVSIIGVLVGSTASTRPRLASAN